MVEFQTTSRQLTSVVMAAACVAALVAPRRRWVTDTLAASVVVKTLADLPFAPSHQLLLALFALCWVVARLATLRSPRTATIAAAWTAVRWTFVVAYGFAAFAKLNTTFLDVEVSCVDFLVRSFGASWTGSPEALLPLVPLGIWLTLAVEVAVVPLLLWRRSRPYGVILAVVFHSALAADPPMHVADFAGVVLVGAAAWTTVAGRAAVTRWVGRQLPGRAALWLVGAIAALGSLVIVAVGYSLWLFWALSMLLLVAATVAVGVAAWRDRGAVGDPVTAGPATAFSRMAAGVLLVPAALALVNGATPYLELKNDAAWNMYSNLRTTNGESNHLLVRRSLPLSDALSDLVEVEDAPAGQRLPRTLVHQGLLVDRGGYVLLADGSEITYEEAVYATGPLELRFRPLRPISAEEPQPCSRGTIR